MIHGDIKKLQQSKVAKMDKKQRDYLFKNININECIIALNNLKPTPTQIYLGGKEYEIDMINLNRPLVMFDYFEPLEFANEKDEIKRVHIELNYYDLLTIITLKCKENKDE